jgi:hypothetical protein
MYLFKIGKTEGGDRTYRYVKLVFTAQQEDNVDGRLGDLRQVEDRMAHTSSWKCILRADVAHVGAGWFEHWGKIFILPVWVDIFDVDSL